MNYLRDITRKTCDDPALKDAMAKGNLMMACMGGERFKSFMNAPSDSFKLLLTRIAVQK